MRWTTTSSGEVVLIAYPLIIRSERFLVDITTRRATMLLIVLPITFS